MLKTNVTSNSLKTVSCGQSFFSEISVKDWEVESSP
nr:MAG TPA: hypothetical protein [Bacteriophage sp.]